MPLRRFLSDIEIYLKTVNRLRMQYPDSFDTFKTIILLPRWKSSLKHPPDSLQREMPWMTFFVIEFLETVLKADMHVFEYGSGGSTLFFAKRVRQVISVEHDADWADKVAHQLRTHAYEHVRLWLVPPDEEAASCVDPATVPSAYVSHMSSASFERYVRSIDGFPDDFFDVIVIDGRARASCLKHAVPKVKPGGYIVLDDSDRERYQAAICVLPANFKQRDFIGPRLHERMFTHTSVWQRCL